MEQILFAQGHLVGVDAFHVSLRHDWRWSRTNASTVSVIWADVDWRGCLPSISEMRCLHVASMAQTSNTCAGGAGLMRVHTVRIRMPGLHDAATAAAC